jgi:hypothetical protein
MRFLIQKIDKEIRHDFSFTLLESIRYYKWLQGDDADMQVKYINCKANDGVWFFKQFHQHYVPVGSVEFVTSWFKRFYDHEPKPINVPEELFKHPSFEFTQRRMFNGNFMDIEDLTGEWFVKSNDKIKGIAGLYDLTGDEIPVCAGNYQFSERIEIESEWRVFVYQEKLVGLQNYAGDFTRFPNVEVINEMIKAYKSAPVAYTLDVGVGDEIYHETFGFHLWNKTFVIEVHDFFSCGLYGFGDHKIYPYMLYRWFHEYLNKLKNGK